MKTLIVEDDPLQRLERELQIKLFGFEYTSCEEATAALEAYQQMFYPLIVTDLGLPGMDGLEFCRCVRALPYGEQSLILMISGSDSPKNREAAMDAGVDKFLSKPVTSAHFMKRVLALLQVGGDAL